MSTRKATKKATRKIGTTKEEPDRLEHSIAECGKAVDRLTRLVEAGELDAICAKNPEPS